MDNRHHNHIIARSIENMKRNATSNFFSFCSQMNYTQNMSGGINRQKEHLHLVKRGIATRDTKDPQSLTSVLDYLCDIIIQYVYY